MAKAWYIEQNSSLEIARNWQGERFEKGKWANVVREKETQLNGQDQQMKWLFASQKSIFQNIIQNNAYVYITKMKKDTFIEEEKNTSGWKSFSSFGKIWCKSLDSQSYTDWAIEPRKLFQGFVWVATSSKVTGGRKEINGTQGSTSNLPSAQHQKTKKKPCVVAWTFNPSTSQAKVGRALWVWY